MDITVTYGKGFVQERLPVDAVLDAIEKVGCPTRAQILELEKYLLEGPQTILPLKHHFSPGMYAREMFIPAGTVLTGAVHKTEHLTVFVGDITVLTDEGMKRLTGHNTVLSKPGAKRVGYAHADTWCTGFFVTDETNVEQLENDLVEDAHLLQNRRPALAGAAPLKLEA